MNVDFIYVAVTRPSIPPQPPLAHLCANINITYLFILRETFKVEPPAGPWSVAAAPPTADTGYPTENSILAQLVTWRRSGGGGEW